MGYGNGGIAMIVDVYNTVYGVTRKAVKDAIHYSPVRDSMEERAASSVSSNVTAVVYEQVEMEIWNALL
jgi:hypothetical protein